ncbi:hypothetical protein GKE73_17825 [Paludibacterium sp. dN 18-1]|uniref:Histidine kinase-like sensor domain-containing protein n=1 Tax=Paludibacterium denitrificans TaxID=2675226 RepID=A0A844GH55_9NEIS|nr:hypothetical protein [Paludibacterium denitrificans]
MIIERDVTRNQHLLDLSLHAVIEGVQDPGVMKLPPRYRRLVLFDRSVSEGPYVGASVYVDAHGDVVTEARSDTPRVANFADFAWFKGHRAHSDIGLYISAPYPLRLHNHKLGIVMSRRVNHSDGAFAGVAATSIDLDYFERLLSGLKVGTKGVITLMQPDGTIVMRVPGRQAWVGKSLLHSETFQRYQRWHERSFVGRATSDGVERLFVIRQFKNAPFVISVGLGTEDIYANWREHALRVAGLMVLLVIGLLAAARLLAQEFKHRLTVEKSLSLLARQDGLTGLNNRRTLDEVYQQELKRVSRTGSPLVGIVRRYRPFQTIQRHLWSSGGRQSADQRSWGYCTQHQAATGYCRTFRWRRIRDHPA